MAGNTQGPGSGECTPVSVTRLHLDEQRPHPLGSGCVPVWTAARRALLQLYLPRCESWRCALVAGVRAAGPSFLEEGSPHHLVTPRVPRDARIFRPAVLVASALALACVVAAVASSGGKRSAMMATGTSSEVPLAMMPDPAEAVHVAQETVTQVDPFHSDGSWIGARPPRPLPPRASPPSGALAEHHC